VTLSNTSAAADIERPATVYDIGLNGDALARRAARAAARQG
jgi:hypothetical protein